MVLELLEGLIKSWISWFEIRKSSIHLLLKTLFFFAFRIKESRDPQPIQTTGQRIISNLQCQTRHLSKAASEI